MEIYTIKTYSSVWDKEIYPDDTLQIYTTRQDALKLVNFIWGIRDSWTKAIRLYQDTDLIVELLHEEE
jgi:hypothetical protein